MNRKWVGKIAEIKKLPTETEEQFLWKVGQLVDSHKVKDWRSINDIVNKELGIAKNKWRDESSFRKRYQTAKKFYNGCFSKMQSEEYQKQLDILNRELQRNTIKFRDQRNAWQRQNYADTRVEETLELLETELKQLGKVNFKTHNTPIISPGSEMIICLSDLHVGQTFSSVFGEYNSDIAKRRLNEYLDKIIEVGKLHNVRKVHTISLGDQISGSIHKSVAITNKENVIEQIKLATEFISSFCYELTKYFEVVQFYNVSGNHTRIDRKDDALHNERLDDTIGWAVSLSLSHIENFHYMKHRNLDIGLADLSVCGKTYIACHGDYDPMNKQGVSNLCMLLGFIPTGIFRGHMHYPAINELNGVKVIQSGSLVGSGDDYTIERRLTGRPSQILCVCNSNGIECIYNVDLH